MKPAFMQAGRRFGDASARWLATLALALCVGAAAPEPIVQTRAEPILVESVAFDARGRMLVSAIHAPGIYRIGRRGQLQRWSECDVRGCKNGGAGFYGMVADPARNDLWAVSTGSVYSGTPQISPALWRFNLRTGRVLAVVNGDESAKSFGDIALAPDGTVFVSDSGAGAVLKMAPGATALEQVIKLEGRASPQGLAVSDDGGVLVFSNYADGLHRIDLRSGEHIRVLNAEGKGLAGIDGVVRRGDEFILVYNGAPPGQIFRVRLDADWRTMLSFEVLVDGASLAEPTSGVLRGDDFVFVSRSQWTDFDAQGRPKPDLKPAVVSRLRLPPPG